MREGYQFEVRAVEKDLFHGQDLVGAMMDDVTTSELAVSPPACVPPAMTLIGERVSQLFNLVTY